MSTFLPKKRTFFYTRLVIPKRLRVHFDGRREIWRSLGTVEKDEATYRSLQFEASAQRLLRTLTQHGRRMTKYQIETLISRWLEEALDEAEDARAMGGPIADGWK